MSLAELQELLAVLAATPAHIEGLLADLADEQLRRRPAKDQFSVVETVCHLRDIEIEGYTLRINRLLTEDQPLLPDLNGAQLAVERGYDKQDTYDALRAFTAARMANVGALKGIGSAELERAGTLEGAGPISLGQLLSMMRGHDAEHLSEVAEIHRNLTQLEEPDSL